MSAAATSTLAAAPNLRDFSVIKKVGAGSFGTVFLARHKPSSARVALKVIAKNPPRGEDTTTAHSKASSRKSKKNKEKECSTGALEEKLRMEVPAGDKTWEVTESTLEEYFALRRLQGEERVLQIYAAFHDLRYYYIATVSFPQWFILCVARETDVELVRLIIRGEICMNSWVCIGICLLSVLGFMLPTW